MDIVKYDEFCFKLYNVLCNIESGRATTRYIFLFKNEVILWYDGKVYNTDCTGLICEVLKECSVNSVYSNFYADLCTYAYLRDDKYHHDLRVGFPRIYPQYNPTTVYSEDLYMFCYISNLIIDFKDIHMGDLCLSKRRTKYSTGHSFVFWSKIDDNSFYCIECSYTNNGIKKVVKQIDNLENYAFARISLYSKYNTV